MFIIRKQLKDQGIDSLAALMALQTGESPDGRKPIVSVSSLGGSIFFSSRRRHTRLQGDWSSDVCSSGSGSDRYLPFLPIILNWIQQTLDAHAHERRAVASFNFPHLPRYFSEILLNTARVVACDRLPVPPVSALGLREFADFQELVHVVQWQVLGPKDFLLLYAAGFSEHGYRRCPLEALAFDHQRRFDGGQPPYSVEEEVWRQTLALKATI